MLMMPAAARADERAFQWVSIAPPSGSTLFGVHDVNNAGHVLARLTTSSGTRGAVWRDGQWHVLEVFEDHVTYVTDINNNGVVVGYSGTGSGLRGRIWSYNAQNENYDLGQDLGTQTEIWSINDSDELAGFDVANGYPVGWFAEQNGWIELLPLQGGDATAAIGLNNAGPPATIVGRSTEPYGPPPATLPWAVVWMGSTTPTKVDATQSDVTDTPYIINDNDWIVGARGTNPYTYILWRPDGLGGWSGVESLEVTGGSAKAVGLNSSNEVVAKKTLFHEDGQGALQSVSLTTLGGIPTSTGPLGHFNSTNLAFYAINDNGWIIGSATYYDADAQDQGKMAVLLVPFDRGNDGTPDYREIIADPTLDNDTLTGDNWVLDHSERMRVGLHAPGTDDYSPQVDNAQIIRQMRQHDHIYNAMVSNGSTCEAQALDATKWGYDVNYNLGDPKEIIVTIRTILPATDDDRDYVLPLSNPAEGEITQAQAEAGIECFAHRFARCVDYVQLGNEIWTGNGGYWIRTGQLPNNAPTYFGYLTNVPTDAFDEALDLMFDQLQGQVDAAKRGAALAGRPLRIIGPATGLSTTLLGVGGDVNGNFELYGLAGDAVPDRCARFTMRLIAFCNYNDIAVDCHYITFLEEDFLDAVEALADPASFLQYGWETPEQKTCLELAAVPSAKDGDMSGEFWWQNDDLQDTANSAWTSTFFDENTLPNLPPDIDTWEDWQEYWLDPQSSHVDGKYNLPATFPLGAFGTLESFGNSIACFPCRQNTGEATVARTLDMTAIYADKLKRETSAHFVDFWQDAFEYAASQFQISPWNPHQSECPLSPCPPCGE